MKKLQMCLISFCMSSSLVIKLVNLLSKLTQHGLKDALSIEQYVVGFWCTQVEIRVLNVNVVQDDELQFAIKYI